MVCCSIACDRSSSSFIYSSGYSFHIYKAWRTSLCCLNLWRLKVKYYKYFYISLPTGSEVYWGQHSYLITANWSCSIKRHNFFYVFFNEERRHHSLNWQNVKLTINTGVLAIQNARCGHHHPEVNLNKDTSSQLNETYVLKTPERKIIMTTIIFV